MTTTFKRALVLAALAALGGCTYTVTDDPAVAELRQELSTLSQRLDALDQRVTNQGEVLNRRVR